MKYVWLYIIIGLSLHAQDKPAIENLKWLAGCWDGSTDKKENVEQWMKPSGKMMMGMSRTVKNGKVTEYEFMRIHQEENGDIFYTANPSGQSEASFKLIQSGEHEMVFQNAEHDFPQRIIYVLEKDGSLKARIE